MDRVNLLLEKNKELYSMYQIIVEHVSRIWYSKTRARVYLFSNTITQKDEKRKHLYFFIYNLKRVINFVGAKKLTAFFKARGQKKYQALHARKA
ncbi:MAG: hypothetical protein ACOWWR_13325 [Eubacteriales bacterium]